MDLAGTIILKLKMWGYSICPEGGTKDERGTNDAYKKGQKQRTATDSLWTGNFGEKTSCFEDRNYCELW